MIHLTRDLVEILLRNVIVPSASSLGDVDGVINLLKQGIVSYVVETGAAPKEALAKIFDKSDRWLYRQIEEMAREERRQVGDSHNGFDLMARTVEYYTRIHPQDAPAQACVHHLRRSKLDITVHALEPILNLCVDQGHLVRLTVEAGGHKETVYKSPSNAFRLSPLTDQQDRRQKVARRVRFLFPMLRSYIEGHPLARCSMLTVIMTEERQQRLIEQSYRYMLDLMTTLREEEDRLNPDNTEEPVELRLLFISGAGPFPGYAAPET